MRKYAVWAVVASLVAFSGAAQASALAGRFEFISGKVFVVSPDGAERLAQKGMQVDERDTVVTGRNAIAQLLMVDNAIIALRPDTRLDISVYQYAAQHKDAHHAGRSVLDLIKGGLRAITGVIGHVNHGDDVIHTATATIGIRGTDHDPMYIPAPAHGATPIGPPGTYDMVNKGGTYIQNSTGRVDIAANQVGFAGLGLGVEPVLLKTIPSFMLPTPPIRKKGSGSGAGNQFGSFLPGFGGPVLWYDVFLPNTVTASTVTPPPPAAPVNYATVSGDLGTSGANSNGFTLSGQQASNFFGSNAPIQTSAYQYTPVGSPIASGSGTFQDGGTVTVNWGIYAQGQVTTPQGTRQVNYVQVMSAPATPDSVLPTLSGTYSNVVTSAMVTEGGVTGGTMNSVNITLLNGQLTAYAIGLTDGASRTWAASCSSCSGGVSLSSFKSTGVALTGTLADGPDDFGSPEAPVTGQATGSPIGPTGKGMISSFALQGDNLSVTGSFAATK